MKKVIFGIFAHPDDEAFGPSGTLLKLGEEGSDIHLILLTDGDAGQNVDGVADLAATRLAEWRAAAELLGATTTHTLHYPDGELDKVDLTEIVEKSSAVITNILASYEEETEVNFMSFEPQGLTGHRDHIAASKLATQLARQFHAQTVWYFCLDGSQAPLDETEYYKPRAREDDYITTRIDITPWQDAKHQIMDAHYSQRSDAETMKALGHTHESFHVDILSS